jgi:hypothetical protein
MRRKRIVTCLSAVAFLFAASVLAEEGRWADANDATAQALIARERQWAEQTCTHTMVVDTLLADDFQGTSPDGVRYSRTDAINDAESDDVVARDCRLDAATVHFFGDTTAVIYGNERFTTDVAGGGTLTRCLIWTDTWLKRGGLWQVVAVQDMWADCKNAS